MHEIKNLTNSPYDLDSEDGPVRLPAMGNITGRFAPEYTQSLIGLGLYEVREVREVHPLDHDGDGHPGGSPKGAQSTRAKGARARKTKEA